MARSLVCWNCGASLDDVPRPISRHADCPKCHEVLHCCRMCRWYAPGKPGDCEDDRADPPVEKESANFCEYYSPALGSFVSAEAQQKDAAKTRLDALFGGSEGDEEDDDEDEDPDDPKSRLNDLFDD